MEEEPELQTNAAAVDNELALLPVFGLPEGGYVPNIFFDDQVTGIKRVGPELGEENDPCHAAGWPQALRCSPDDRRCLRAENNRLAGLAVVDTAASPM